MTSRSLCCLSVPMATRSDRPSSDSAPTRHNCGGLRGSSHQHLRSSWIDREVCCGTTVGVGEVADRGVGGAGVPSRVIGKEIGRAHRTVWAYIRVLPPPTGPGPDAVAVAVVVD